MPIPIQRVIEGRRKVLTIRADQTIREALEIMLGNSFNQLPVVDAENHLKGLISSRSILRTYYHSTGKSPLLDLTVSHCQEPARVLTPQDDLTDALEILESRESGTIVIVDKQVPVGILTNHIITQYFREISEAQIYVENIELALRAYVETVFPDERSKQDALMAAFGPDPHNAKKPAKDYNYLGFWDTMKLITEDKNWDKFQGILEPRQLFWALLDQVRITRNKLAHFRDRPTPIQHEGLKAAWNWLSTRPKLTSPAPSGSDSTKKDRQPNA